MLVLIRSLANLLYGQTIDRGARGEWACDRGEQRTGKRWAYALERYYTQSGGPLTGFMTGGVSTILAAAKSVEAAAEAGALQHDPEAVDTAIKKLTDFEAVLDKMHRRSRLLGSKTPLGGGYAEEVGEFNKAIGEVAGEKVIPDLIKAIRELKAQLDKSRKSYRNVEEGASGTFKQL